MPFLLVTRVFIFVSRSTDEVLNCETARGLGTECIGVRHCPKKRAERPRKKFSHARATSPHIRRACPQAKMTGKGNRAHRG